MAEGSLAVQALTGLDQLSRWNVAAPLGTPIVVTYSFPDAPADYEVAARPGYAAFSAAHQVHARTALAQWSAAAGISFVEVPAVAGGQIRFGMFDMTGLVNSVGNQLSGFAYRPDYGAIITDGGAIPTPRFDSLGGDVFLNANFYAALSSELAPETRGYSILAHEIGHALGFKHPFEGDPVIDPAMDNGAFTIMSYDRSHRASVNLGTLDVEAMRLYYGAAPFPHHLDPATLRLTIEATDASEWVLGTELADILRAGAGDDVIRGEIGDDELLGGSGVDTLFGGDGDDVLDGGANPEGRGDVMLGGEGDDTYNVDNGLDLVDEGVIFPEFGFGGVDTIVSTADFYWDFYSIAEVLIISEDAVDPEGDGSTIVGSVFSGELVGNSKTNVLFGRGGSDTYRAGDGTDFISLSTLGVTDENSYAGVDGVNTVIVEERTSGDFSYDIVFEFEAGKDKLDVSDYGFASAAAALATGVDDGAGNSYFILGDGLDYLYMVGVTLEEMSAGDFVV